MDLSKTAKTRRDAVEAPLFRSEKLLDALEEVNTRVNATTKAWHETQRTLDPALEKLTQVIAEVAGLKQELEALWKQGAANKWK